MPRRVIILDLDTLRADHLSAYGYERPTSPNIDRLAAQGFRFEWAFSQAPNTPPSQTSIFTSLYPSRHGMIEDGDRVPESVVTLAEVYRDAGVRTAAFVDGGYMSEVFDIDQGFDEYRNLAGGGLQAIGPKVFDWLNTHGQEEFLLLVHTYDIHTPYSPPEPFRSMFAADHPPDTEGFEPTSEVIESIRLSRYTEEGERRLSDGDLAFTKARYDGGIRYVDNWIGELTGHLEELGLLDEVMLVIISDHGEEFQEHGSLSHDRLYATVTRVPLILRRPGQVEGRVIEDVVETIDLMPTLLDLHSLPHPPGIQGRSLVPLMDGARRNNAVAVSESPYFGGRRAVTTNDWRLISTLSSDQSEFYRYRSDPLEQQDLGVGHPERERLEQTLERWLASVGPMIECCEEEGTLDEATRRQLEKLGYIQ